MHRYRLLRYRLFDVDGDEIGEINVADPPRRGDEIHTAPGRRVRVVAVVPATEASSLFNGMLMVEPAPPSLEVA
jgi:hypothetical protein